DRAMDATTASDSGNFALAPDPFTTGVPITVEFLPQVNSVRIIPTSLLVTGKKHRASVSGAWKSDTCTQPGSTQTMPLDTAAAANNIAISRDHATADPAAGGFGTISIKWTNAQNCKSRPHAAGNSTNH